MKVETCLLVVLTTFCSNLTLGAFVPAEYVVPEPNIEVFSPRGFQVSIPDDEGISLFAFHGNINKEMAGLEAGQFSKDIFRQTGDMWVFDDRRIRLAKGDVIYYWLFVIKNGLGYRYDNGVYTVEDFIPRPHQEKTHPQSSTNHKKTDSHVNKDELATIALMYENQQNLTNVVNELSKQLKALKDITHILVSLVAKDDGSSRTLKFEGILPPYDDAEYVTQIIINEKMGVSIPVVNATWSADKSAITFEVASLDDKLFLIKTAKEKLKNSKIMLID